MKKCSRCRKEKPLSEFTKKKSAKDGFNAACKECTRKVTKSHYKDNKKYYLEKASKRNRDLAPVLKAHILEHFQANPCVDCGETDWRLLEFDHVGEKKYNISEMVKNGYSLKALQREISECEVRCVKCHRLKTIEQFGWYQYLDA